MCVCRIGVQFYHCDRGNLCQEISGEPLGTTYPATSAGTGAENFYALRWAGEVRGHWL